MLRHLNRLHHIVNFKTWHLHCDPKRNIARIDRSIANLLLLLTCSYFCVKEIITIKVCVFSISNIYVYLQIQFKYESFANFQKALNNFLSFQIRLVFFHFNSRSVLIWFDSVANGTRHILVFLIKNNSLTMTNL